MPSPWNQNSEAMKAKVGAACLILSQATAGDIVAAATQSRRQAISRLLPLGIAARGREESPVH